jgi:integrase
MASIDDRWWMRLADGRRVKSPRFGQGQQWRARYYDAAGKQHAKHVNRKQDAETWLTSVTADLLRGTYIDPKRADTTVQEYAAQWLVSQHARATTLAQYESYLRNHILPVFGSKRLGQVTPTMVRGFTKTLADTLAPTTVATVHRVVSMIFRSAVADGYLAKSPCQKTAPRKPAQRPVSPLTPDEVQRLAQAMPQRLGALVYACAGLGLRQGEALGLTVERVRFLERRVVVSEQLQTLPNGQRVMVPPKTASSVRTVPLPAFVAQELAAHLEMFPPGPDGLVFTNGLGAPWNRSRFGEVWRAAVKRAALPVGTRLHDLRHSYAALLIAAGEHPKVIQARLGHASITETMDTYGHLFPEAESATRDALDAAFTTSAKDRVRTVEGRHGL